MYFGGYNIITLFIPSHSSLQTLPYTPPFLKFFIICLCLWCICIMCMYTYMYACDDTSYLCDLYQILWIIHNTYMYIYREIQDPILILLSDSTCTTPFVTNPSLLIWRWADRVSTQTESIKHIHSAPRSPLSLKHTDWIHFSAHGQPPMPSYWEPRQGHNLGTSQLPGTTALPMSYKEPISCGWE